MLIPSFVSVSVRSVIASSCTDSTIRHCGVGRFADTSRDVELVQNNNNATLEKNVCIDSNAYSYSANNAQLRTVAVLMGKGALSANDAQCRTVAADLFKQRYFEHTLEWDFDSVWEWDAKENRPALRHAASVQQAAPAASNANMMDLLTQQIRANIWL